MKQGFIILFAALPILAHISCNQKARSSPAERGNSGAPVSSTAGFNHYWYLGKAEISSYHLEQARYGEIRNGEAVLIFVTEDFSQSKHVKIDNPGIAGNDLVKILKLNFTKKFTTGIYPYSMMASVFTPVNLSQFPYSLKTTATSQEWCGHTFTQLDLEENDFKVTQFSYFEEEGDRSFKTEKVLLEDEIWNRIRISPASLPTGETKMLPGTFFVRLKHVEMKPEKVKLTLSENPNGQKISTYKIEYMETDRTLIINFQKDFPNQIQSWEETYMDGWGADAKKLITRATLNKTLFTDYWTKNKNSDSYWRDSLGLSH